MTIIFLTKIFTFFLINELKLIFAKLKYVILFVKKIDLINFSKNSERNFKLLKNDKEKKILIKNQNFFKEKFLNKNSENFLLITSLLTSKLYSINNIIIGMNLCKILNKIPVALIRKDDFGTEIFMRSFGINKFYYISNENFFYRLKYLILSISLLKGVKNIDQLLKFKYKEIFFGKIIYDHYVRFIRVGSVSYIHPKFYLFFSQALMNYYQAKKIFDNLDIKEIVQTENQFIPSAPVFQLGLLNKCKIFCKIGRSNFISVRKYQNFSEVYKNRRRFSTKLFNHIFQKNKTIAINYGNQIIQKRISGHKKFGVDQSRSIEFKGMDDQDKIFDFTKNQLCEKLNWDNKLPIVTIFSNDFIDGIFTNSWNLYRDRIMWLRATLDYIKNIKNINWLIKPHPNEIKNKVKTSTPLEVQKYSKYKNIRLFPKDYAIKPLSKIINCAVSAQGSVGYEYPALGVPCIICGESLSSGHGISIEPKTEEEYFNYLKNINEIDSVTKDQMDKAKVFIYIYSELSRVFSPLLPNSLSNDFKYENFYHEYEKLIDNYDFKKDSLCINLKSQLSLGDRHTINYELIEK